MDNHSFPSFRRSVNHRALTASGLAGLIAACGIAWGVLGAFQAAQARQGAGPFPIYQGVPVQSSGMTLASWGSGSVTEDPKNVYSGSESLRVVTHGQFQGASLHLSKPVDLGSYVTDKNAYLQLALLLPATGDRMAASGLGKPGFGGPGGLPGSGGPGSGGQSGSALAPTTKPKGIENIRMVLIRPSGTSVEVSLPLANAVPENSWKLLSIPVAAIPGVSASSAKFSEIRLFGDNAGIMYVGRIGVVLDSTPIKLTAPTEMIVEVRKPYRYVASATSGATSLKYSWDWDQTDGIQEESIGRSVIHTYYNMGQNKGDFIATLTVSDVYGIKPPVKSTFKIHVHE